jgi:hypothetical protein
MSSRGAKLIRCPLPDPVPAAAITSASLSGNRKAKATCNPSAVVALTADTKSTGRYCQVMAQSAIDKIPPGQKLDALTAEKVFGWKNVHKHHDRGALYGGTFHSSDVLSCSCVETAFPTRTEGRN